MPDDEALAPKERRQQQQALSRGNTLAKKQQGRQRDLTFMAYDPAVLNRLPDYVQAQVGNA